MIQNIHPLTKSNTLTIEKVKTLHESITKILKSAIHNGGSTLKDYRHIDGTSGMAQLQHQVYNKTGYTCSKCTTIIHELKISGRSTYFCPTCQKD